MPWGGAGALSGEGERDGTRRAVGIRGVHEPMTLGVWPGGAGCYFRRLVRRKALSHQCIAILQSVAGLKASPVAPGTYLLAFLSSLNAKFILEKDEVGGRKERVV